MPTFADFVEQKADQLPSFIKDNPLLKDNKNNIRKIFPEIGLPSFSIAINEKDHPFFGKNIVFSCNGISGLWDIATMAMRGTFSCQSWNITKHAPHLIGSILDPHCGIIYVEDPQIKNNFGSTMLKRSLVRFVLSRKNNPRIRLERVYSNNGEQINYHNNADNMLETTKKVFLKALKSNCSNNILSLKNNISFFKNNFFERIPRSEIINSIPENQLSLRDSGIIYSKEVYSIDAILIKGNKK